MRNVCSVAALMATTVVMLGACALLPVKGGGECKSFPQKEMMGNRQVEGTAVACTDDQGVWHTQSFKDAQGNDLPAPSEILYPQPEVIQTRPKTVFTPSQPVNAMPLPPVTIYRE